ncbi:MAG: universal stress protein, partial [Ktedonobacteraceae bacterium]
MNKCIVLGVDAPLSPATQQAIRTIKDLIGPLSPRLILLHVISIPHAASPALGMYAGQQMETTAVTAEQRQEAEKVLDAVRSSLQEQAQNSPPIEIYIRLGSPAEEVSRVAQEMHADLVIVGCRGNAVSERIRRFFLGSKSHKILQLAPCPVLIVSLQQAKRPTDLVAWYEEAITLYLREHTGRLTIFTVAQLLRLFASPLGNKSVRHKERA